MENKEETSTAIQISINSKVENGKDSTHMFFLAVVLLIIILLLSGILTCLKLRVRKLKKVKKKHKHKRAVDYLECTACPTTSDDICNCEIPTAENTPFHISKVHSAGKRSDQQDSFGLSDVENEEIINQKGLLAVVADGMGGLENGDQVSAIATVAMLRYFDEKILSETMNQELLNMLDSANEDVNEYLGKNMLGRCGTTLVAILIKENNLHWISVGDSGIYLYRNNQLKELNQKHNYAFVLNEKVENGELTPEEAASNPERAALTSYIGEGEIALIDYNEIPLELQSGDRVILMSDGVFGTLSDDEITYLMHFDVNEAALKMQYMIEEKDKKNQDNYTALLIEYVK